MSRTPYLVLGLLLAGLVNASTPALCDETAASGTSSADANKSWLEKNGKASYVMWLQQMHTEALSGNRDGTGTALLNEHFFSVGAKLSDALTLKGTVYADQNIDEDDSTRNFEPGDIYLTLSDSKLYKNELYSFNVDGYLRLYLPTSATTTNALNKGTTSDAGHGKIRVLVNPVKSWFDGKLSFSSLFYANFYFNSMTPQERFDRGTRQNALDGTTKPSSFRQDMYFVYDPSVTYSVSSKVDLYLEWCTGVLRHYTAGVINDGTAHPVDSRWTSINHPSDGMYLSPGVNWNPTKKISVNPYISYQLSAVHETAVNSPKRRVGLLYGDVGLQLQYTFN